MVINRIIYSCYLLLIGLVPFLFYSKNFELFEFNKMIAVYCLTVIITASWFLKMLKAKKWIFQSSPLDLPLIIFLITQILATIFSIDQHTSIFGYYSRLNGGLLSTISYLLLYWAFISNFYGQTKQIFNLLRVGILSGVLISIWAILEHFGHSFSCQLLIGQFNDSCWVQDVQARVFASLGQPNWLAAYLEMLLFIAIYFSLVTKNKTLQALYLGSCILIYLAFTFTYSRGAMLGLLVGLGMFGLLGFFYKSMTKDQISRTKLFGTWSLIIGTFLIINLLFASALTNFKLIHQDAPPPRPGIVSQTSGSQLESGGTESGQIRLIVWKGAWQIFLHYPILGSGVETFAYSYYNYRPVEHNLVSEWDFLYNKAHNEFLNYLATTGVLGFGSYMLLILTFIAWSIRSMYNQVDQSKKLFTGAILGAYLSYLIQNIFQFSVVIIAVFFFIFPAVVFSLTDLKKTDFWPFKKVALPKWLDRSLNKIAITLISKNSLTYNIIIGIVIIISGFLMITIHNMWVADTHYALGKQYLQNDNAGQAYNELVEAVDLNPYEPLYLSDLGLAAANAALALQSEDATLSGQIKDRSVGATLEALNTSPRNVSLWRTAYRSFFVLSALDPKYQEQTLNAVDTVTLLAPTDPETYINKALILNSFGKTDLAVDAAKQAITLKPDYRDAKLTLADLYIKLGQKDQAKEVLNEVLKQIPNDPDALSKLKSIDNSK